MYVFGNRSNDNLATCHEDLQLVARESIKVSQVDFGISQGERTIKKQQQYFNEGKSKVNPRAYRDIQTLFSKGKHLTDPDLRPLAWAWDFYAYVPGNKKMAYDLTHIMYLVGVITATGNRLLAEGMITHKIRSGANWDGDGQLRYDQTFFDSPHIEIIDV